jgi:hypothetical protein
MDRRDGQRENKVYELWFTLLLEEKIHGSAVAISGFEVRSLKRPYIKE